jgi:hypothetical protein
MTPEVRCRFCSFSVDARFSSPWIKLKKHIKKEHATESKQIHRHAYVTTDQRLRFLAGERRENTADFPPLPEVLGINA